MGKCVSEGRQGLHPMVGTDETRSPDKGVKDPMMMWNFPDGEIRRLPLMRQRASALSTACTHKGNTEESTTDGHG